MEVGLAIAGLAVASALSMLTLARFAPRGPPPGPSQPLVGNTPAGHPWTLDPDRSRPDRTRWIWRSPMPAHVHVAGWRGERADWHRWALEATGRPGNLPNQVEQRGPWALAGKSVQDGRIVDSAPDGVSAFGWEGSGWVVADLPAEESPADLVVFAGRLADHIHTREPL